MSRDNGMSLSPLLFRTTRRHVLSTDFWDSCLRHARPSRLTYGQTQRPSLPLTLNSIAPFCPNCSGIMRGLWQKKDGSKSIYKKTVDFLEANGCSFLYCSSWITQQLCQQQLCQQQLYQQQLYQLYPEQEPALSCYHKKRKR